MFIEVFPSIYDPTDNSAPGALLAHMTQSRQTLDYAY